MPHTPTLTQEATAAPALSVLGAPEESRALVPAGAPGPQAAAAKRFRIAGDVVNRATKDLDDRERSELRWLHMYGHEQNLSLEELASMIKKPSGQPYSAASVYQALTGRRSAADVSLAPLCEAIAKLRRIVTEQATITRVPYVHTNLSKRVWQVCETARTFQTPCFIFGESQIGKTTSLEEYTRKHNHGGTIYVRMPTRGTLGEFLRWTALALRISPQQKSEWFLKQRIISAFDPRMVLIVDEAHQALLYSWGRGGAATLEFVREIHDRSKCGVVISATLAFDEQMQAGVHSRLLRQLGLRRLTTYRMPHRPTRSNLDQFAEAYGLRPAAGEALELQTAIIRDDGLGRWTKILLGSSRVAAKAGKTMDWPHVLKAHAAIAALEGGGGDQ